MANLWLLRPSFVRATKILPGGSPLDVYCMLCFNLGVVLVAFVCLSSLILTCEISTRISRREFKDVHMSNIRMRNVTHVGNILVYD